MSYQSATGLRAFEFSLGAVFARTPEDAHRIASRYGMWDRRPDGTWGQDATDAHAQLCRDQQAAYRHLANADNEAARRALAAGVPARDSSERR